MSLGRAELRHKLKVIIGGAQFLEEYGEEIKADAVARDAIDGGVRHLQNMECVRTNRVRE